MMLNPFLFGGVLGFQVNAWFEEQIASPPWGTCARSEAEW